MATKRIDKANTPCNSPKRTPLHPNKSHVVKACVGEKQKVIRFGEKGAKTAGAPKLGEGTSVKNKRKSVKARHREDIAKGKMSSAWWSDREKF
jgi:hypothetical protein